MTSGTGGDFSLAIPIPHASCAQWEDVGLASPVDTPSVLEQDEVKHLEAGVGLKQFHDEGSGPVVQFSKALWRRGHP